MSSVKLDDLWMAGFLVAEGAKLKAVAVVPYSNGRMQAFFELEDVPADAMESYANADPWVRVHDLRAALYQLRAAMGEAIAARNGNNNHNQSKTKQTRSNHEQNPARSNR
jgi:hypothetical protein